MNVQPSMLVNREPDRTSRGQAWAGVVADLHWWADAGEAIAGAPDHDILAMRVAGTSPLVQRRDGKVDERTVTYGNVTIHPRGLDSHWSWTKPGAILLMRAPAALLAETQARSGDTRELPNAFGLRDAKVEDHARQLLAELHRPVHPTQAMRWETLSLTLIAHVIERYAGRSVAQTHRAQLSSAQLMRIEEFIQDRWQRQVTLQDLADIVGLSRFHFSRLFKQTAGMTPMAFVERARLDRARVLVMETQRSMAEIAAVTGFADQSHFCRRFRKAFATTPGQFARNYRPRVVR